MPTQSRSKKISSELQQLTLGQPGLDAGHKASTVDGGGKASISREMGDEQLLTFSAPVSDCDACQAYTSVVHSFEYLCQKLLTLGRLLSSALW